MGLFKVANISVWLENKDGAERTKERKYDSNERGIDSYKRNRKGGLFE